MNARRKQQFLRSAKALVISAIVATAAVPSDRHADGRVAAVSRRAPDQKSKAALAILEKLAEEGVTSDENLGKTRFLVDTKKKQVLYDLNPIRYSQVLPESDPYAVPLEAEVRIHGLRRDFRKVVPQENFWNGPLDEVQGAVDLCVQHVASGEFDAESARAHKECNSLLEPKFAALENTIVSYAASRNFEALPLPQIQERPLGYRVEIKIDPPKARVRIMPELEYKKCQYFKLPLEDQWNDLLEGDVELIGRYHYLAEWPPELNGPEDGAFEIRKPEKLTFRPKS